jgi:hypothetical protein
MASSEAALEQIHPRLRGPMRDYVALLRRLGGENVLALTVFGPAAGIDFDPDERSATSVLIVDHVDLSMLLRLASGGGKLGKQGIAAPLVMTPVYIQASLDTFPLELLDIQARHLTLFGPDHFADLRLEPSHVRLQCERELKTVLIAMRQGLLACRGDNRSIDALEAEAGENLRRTLRGLVWLKGDKSLTDPERMLALLRQTTGRPLPGLGLAMDRQAYHSFTDFEELYRDVEFLAEAINAW